MKILAIEDSDPKWDKIRPVIERLLPGAGITRVRDLHDGERAVEESGWDLLILDISLDIKTGGARSGRGAHDYTAGLKIVGRMYYDECEIPTLIVTGFDAFPTGGSSESNVILGFDEVETQARSFLSDKLLGAVRVGSRDWEKQMSDILGRFAHR